MLRALKLNLTYFITTSRTQRGIIRGEVQHSRHRMLIVLISECICARFHRSKQTLSNTYGGPEFYLLNMIA